jgi:hypothetical protein
VVEEVDLEVEDAIDHQEETVEEAIEGITLATIPLHLLYIENPSPRLTIDIFFKKILILYVAWYYFNMSFPININGKYI